MRRSRSLCKPSTGLPAKNLDALISVNPVTEAGRSAGNASAPALASVTANAKLTRVWSEPRRLDTSIAGDWTRSGDIFIPLASQLRPERLKVDRDTANARVGTWLREVANARVHATTGEVPLVRLELERERLQSMPTPWPGMIQRSRTTAPAPTPRGYQHSLRVYEELITADIE